MITSTLLFNWVVLMGLVSASHKRSSGAKRRVFHAAVLAPDGAEISAVYFSILKIVKRPSAFADRSPQPAMTE